LTICITDAKTMSLINLIELLNLPNLKLNKLLSQKAVSINDNVVVSKEHSIAIPGKYKIKIGKKYLYNIYLHNNDHQVE